VSGSAKENKTQETKALAVACYIFLPKSHMRLLYGRGSTPGGKREPVTGNGGRDIQNKHTEM